MADNSEIAETIIKFLPGQPGFLKEVQKFSHAADFVGDALKQMDNRAVLRDQPEGERSMAAIVKTFNAYSGYALSEADGWAFMIILKMIRGKQGNFNPDDYVDGAAYFGLLGECESKRER